MTATDEHMPTDAGAAPPAGCPRSRARDSARRAKRPGLSLDQVAQQLKLAPRQVKALEDENFARLAGTDLQPRLRAQLRAPAATSTPDDLLLAHLPDVAQAPALESPALHSTGSMMAELPSVVAPQGRTSRAG